MSPRKGKKGGSAKGLFASFLSLRQQFGEAGSMEELLQRCYGEAGWPDELVASDRVRLEAQQAGCPLRLRNVIERGYGYQIGLPCIAIDRLAAALGLGIKLRFPSVAGLDELFATNQPELAAERIHKPEDLRPFTKKGWKKCGLPVGLKVQIEDAIDGHAADSTAAALSSLSVVASPGRMRVHTADGRIFETDRLCPHKQADLGHAAVSGTVVECPKHHWKFDLARGGECINGKWPCSIHAVQLDW